MEKNKKFIMCDCYSHALLLEKDDEDDSLYISMFERGFDGKKMSIRDRLRWAFHIIINGHPYTDMIILDTDKVKDLNNFLKKNFNI